MYKNNTNSNPITTVNRTTTGTLSSASNWGASGKTVADYVKESASWSSNSSITTNNHHNHHLPHHQQQTNNPSTSGPWAAAVKNPPDLSAHFAAAAVASNPSAAAAANSYDYNSSTIGSWSSPETSSSNRSGWNTDGSSKSDGVPDDGTAIWGNPVQKKTGVDWTEKESLMNPPQANNSDKQTRIQKAEPATSSLNGTEAWGAPLRSSPPQKSIISSQQSSAKNDISGNTYGNNKSNNSNSSNEPQLNWGERTTTAVIGSAASSSLSSSRNLQPSSMTNENSSPPLANSVWNSNLGTQGTIGKPSRSSSDWLTNNSASNSSSRMDELNKQLESTSLFDSIAKNSGGNSTNPNLEHHHHQLGLGLSGNNNGLGGLVGGSNVINDLKQQMSANYSNDLLDSSNCQTSNLPSSNNNQQQSQHQMDAAYVSASAPSRDLLKQMVHQIQLAVQAGHLNAHILNQPMSAPTLQLVYHLLQQIKTLHQLLELQQRSGGSKNSDLGSPSALDLQIKRVRQNIALLQKAITQQQASLTKNEAINDMNVKQQQQAAAAAAVAAANNYSYASISKLSTNMKVPSNSNMSNVIGNINIDSFRRSSLIDTLSNSNSDSLRSAQASFDANATIDKSLSSLIQASSANDILGNSNAITTSSDFTKAQGFTGGNVSQQPNKGLFSAQQQAATSSSNAWMAFSSGDFITPGWSRISSNVSQEQQQQFNASDMVPEFGNGGSNKPWRSSGSSILSDEKDNSPSLAPGSGLGMRPNSGSNILKQLNENDFLSRDQSSSFYDWSANNNSDSNKRSFDTGNSAGGGRTPSSVASASSSFKTGLSLQPNPWMFAPSSGPLNIGSGMDNLNKDSNTSGGNSSLNNKMDNGNCDKLATNSLFLKSNNPSNIQRSSSALYDWSDMASASSNVQFGADPNNPMAKHQQHTAVGSASSSGLGGQSRPAPPPGLSSNFQPINANSSSANVISILDKGGSKEETTQLQSRESSSSLWSGAWFD